MPFFFEWEKLSGIAIGYPQILCIMNFFFIFISKKYRSGVYFLLDEFILSSKIETVLKHLVIFYVLNFWKIGFLSFENKIANFTSPGHICMEMMYLSILVNFFFKINSTKDLEYGNWIDFNWNMCYICFSSIFICRYSCGKA